MGCAVGSATPVQHNAARATSSSADPNKTGQPILAKAAADELQKAVDQIFGTAKSKTLLGLEFSFTIADPYLAECPLIGCSIGFTKLCGYELQEIIGHNCRFLVDPVPAHLIDAKVRKQTRDFCQAVNQECRARAAERAAGDPEDGPSSGSPAMVRAGLDATLPSRPKNTFLAMQTNARKDGTFFNNMFYMMVVDLALEFGKERPYIIALQSELPKGAMDLDKVAKNRDTLEARMAMVTRDLAGMFYFRSMICRQSLTESVLLSSQDDGEVRQILSAFMPAEVETWQKEGFKCVKKLSDAARNKGKVWLMETAGPALVAVKEMPNWWILKSHDEFTATRPSEMELPWLDIGCTRLLNRVNWPHVCSLRGVYRDSENTYVVSEFCSEGDLFLHASEGESPGPSREAAFSPLMRQLFLALQNLHDFQIVHRDISLENILLTPGDNGKMMIKLIDFSMASTGRVFRNCPRGKSSYEAPEMTRGEKQYDAFLSDTFAAGVVAFAMFMKDYPWNSTKLGQCKIFEYVAAMGFRAYCARRLASGSQKRIAECASEPVISLLEGLLKFTPVDRLTLGEKQFASRRSVWDEDWSKQFKGTLNI